MKPESEFLLLAFPLHAVSLLPRPDGSGVLTLESNESSISKVIPIDALASEAKIQQLIRDVQRDLKIAAGELRMSGPEARWVWSALPTYESGPIHVTRAKRLSQRPLAQITQRRPQPHLNN